MSPVFLLYVVSRIIMGVASMVTNMLTLVCVFSYKYLRTSSNFLVASLALSDFLHGFLTAIVLPVRYFLPLGNQKRIWCLIGLCIEAATVMGQFITFGALALERRNALLFRLNRSKKWYSRWVILAITLIWTVIAIYNIIITIIYADVPDGTICNVVAYFPSFFTYIGFAIFCTASVAITCSYSHIAWIAHRSGHQVAANGSSSQQATWQNDMKVTRMMAMVVGVFFLLYGPFIIAIMNMSLSNVPTQWHVIVFQVTILIYDVNFFINPFIYAWRNKNFMKAFCNAGSRIHKACCVCKHQHGNIIAPEPEQNIAVLPHREDLEQLGLGASGLEPSELLPTVGTSSTRMPSQTMSMKHPILVPRIP